MRLNFPWLFPLRFRDVRERILQRLRALWQAAKTERATPRQIALAVGVGVMVGCTPAIGFHGGIAVVAATIFRLTRLWTFLGSRVANFVTLPWIIYAEIQLAHRVRTGEWADIFGANALGRARAMLLDWCLGTPPVGLALGATLGGGAYFFARRREKRAASLTADAGTPPDSPPPAAPP